MKDLIIGVKPFGDDDALPTFWDLGGGDLATLLNNANVPVGPDDSLMVIGSTDGQHANILAVAAGQEGAQNSFSPRSWG